MESKDFLTEDYFYKRFDLGLARYADEDYVGALNVFKSLYEEDDKNVDVIREIAKIYMDIDAIRLAHEYWIKFLNVCSKDLRAEAYNALGACNYLLDNLDVAGYYYEMFFSTADEIDYDYLDERIAYVDALKETEKPDYYISYPPKKMSSDKLIEKAEELLFTDEGDDAVKLLKNVPKTDENYLGAQLRIAAHYVLKDETQKAKNLINRLIGAFPNDPLPQINLFVLLSGTGDVEGALTALGKLEKFEITTYLECFKVAASCMDIGLYKVAKEYIERGLRDDPISINGIFMSGAVNYNLGEIETAEKDFTTVYQITGSKIALYYVNLCRKYTEKTRIKHVDYVMRYPDAIVKKYVETTIKYCDEMPKITARNFRSIMDLAEWVFSFPNNLQLKFASALFKTGNKKFIKFLTDQLLINEIPDEVKSCIISQFLLADYKINLSAVKSGIYTKFKLIPLSEVATDDEGAIVKRAYSKTFSYSCGFLAMDFKKMHDFALKTYEFFYDNDLFEFIDDENALAAAFFLLNGETYKNEISFVSKYFDADKKRIKELMNMLKDAHVDC